MSIKVGQVYASTHKGDVAFTTRQRREVVEFDGVFVWLRTLDRPRQPKTRLRVSWAASGPRIPGHRLVEDAPPC